MLDSILQSTQSQQVLGLSIALASEAARMDSTNYPAKIRSLGSLVVAQTVRGETVQARSITNSQLRIGQVVELTKSGSQISFVDARVRG